MSIEVLGEAETNAVLTRIDNMAQEIEPAMDGVRQYVKEWVELETPVDTGRLLGNLQSDVETGPNLVFVEVWYDATYGPYGHRYDHYVKGQQQAWMHARRGVTTIEQDLRAVEPAVTRMIDAAVERVVES